MVNITKTPPVIYTPPATSTSVTAPKDIEKDPKQQLPASVYTERRKREDRRSRKGSRGPFDTRAGTDRRKNGRPGGFIDVDA